MRALITSILTAFGLTASLVTGVAVAWADTAGISPSPDPSVTAPAVAEGSATLESTPELPEVDPLVVEVPATALTVAAAATVTTRVSARTLAARQITMAKKPWGARVVAKSIAKKKHNWGATQFACLNNLWTKESGWRYRANNSRTGAYGIPQAYPGSKMASVARDWRTNPVTQIRWGLRYIDSRYNTPCAAWSKFKRSNWY